MLADARAIEEEVERKNPINPKKQIGSRKGYTGIVRGSGATPSMGLSMVRGGRKGKVRKDGEEETETEPEEDAMEMGRALATHMKQLHGSGFYDEFRKGFEGLVRPVVGSAKLSCSATGGAETGRYEGEGTKKGQTRKTARKAYEAVAEMEGSGKLKIEHLPEGHGEEIILGKGKSKRKAAGPSDARRKRGAMVSKLMKEQGMTLGEASKHIKEHGMD